MENERLIIKMLLEQKTELVTSGTMYESSSVGSYEFPKTKFEVKQKFPNTYMTQFPGERALAATFNATLMGNVYRALGEESRSVNPYFGYIVSNDCAKENVSDDYYYTAKFIQNKIRGLSLGRTAVMLEDVPQTEQEEKIKERLSSDVALNAAPTFLLAKSPEDAEKYLKKFPERLVAGVASDPQEVASFLFYGCTFVYLTHDFKTELDGYLTERTHAYRAAYKDYTAGRITLTELDRRKRNFDVFDESILDGASDRMITLLRTMKSAGEEEVQYTAIAGGTSRRDELNHRNLALAAARQSVVLIKNEGGILPLAPQTRVAVVGEFAENNEYHSEFYTAKPTHENLPFTAINDYELRTVGFTAGYRKGETGRSDLMANAFNLSRDADVTLVYLFVPAGEKRIPREQEELLEILYRDNVRVVAVVDSDGVPDLSFAGKCKAVLLTARGGQEIHRAVLDIITGEISPSGKLTESISFTAENGQRAIAYPFGFGLTYTSFEYRNLKINDGGISCTVVNTGNFDGYAAVQMYVRKDGSTLFHEKALRGVNKVFVKKGDAVRVEIPFDENTFRYYNEKKKRYCIDGGEYEISICENCLIEKLSGKIKLSDYAEERRAENETVKKYHADEEVAFSPNKKDGGEFKEKKGISFGIKLFLAIVLLVYSYGVLGAFASGLIVPIGDLIVHFSVIGAVALVITAIFITLVVIWAKKRKKPQAGTGEALKDMLDKVDDFNEVAKVNYKQPVEKQKPQQQEEVQEKEEKEEVKEEPPKEEVKEKPAARTYDTDFADYSEQEKAETAQRDSMGQLCEDFCNYVRQKGISIEKKSVRALFAALAASKIVIIDCHDYELLPDFATALNGFFMGAGVTVAGDEWNTIEDVLWCERGGKCVLSNFVNTLYAAGKMKRKMCAAIVCNVNASNLTEWFSDFIAYANSPTESYVLELNDHLVMPIPDNLSYVLLPKDGGFDTGVSRALANASVHVKIHMHRNDVFAVKEPTVKPISCMDFAHLVTEAREANFLPEKVWRKLDGIFETIAAGEHFKFGNKNAIQAEKLTSVLMECGADESEALLKLLFAKVIPVLKLTQFYEKEDGDRALCDLIEKAFPEEESVKLRRGILRKAENAEGEGATQTGANEENAETAETAETTENTESVEAETAETTDSTENVETDTIETEETAQVADADDTNGSGEGDTQ